MSPSSLPFDPMLPRFDPDRRYPGTIELAGTDDLERLAALSEELVGFLDPGALAQKTAVDLYRILALPLVSVAIREGSSVFAMRGVHGARNDRFRQVQVSTGKGLGGRVMVERRHIEVRNYADDPRITNHFVDVVNDEGLGGMLAVPVEHDTELVGILYGGIRSIGSIGDRAKNTLAEAARNIAPMMAASIRASAAIQQRVDAERQRIASDLHDDVGQLLFSISVAAQRLRDSGDEQMAQVAVLIEEQAQEATKRMRQAFRVVAPSSEPQAIAVALQRETVDLQARSDLTVHFMVRGSARPLPAPAEAALIGAARQALFNIERHASASLVVVTLHFEESRVSLVIQDDGRGLPDNFEYQAIPRGDHNWGLASILRQAQRQGGDLEVADGEDGGTIVRISLPLEAQ